MEELTKKKGEGNEENLKKVLMAEAEKMGDRGKLLWPLRAALSGKEASSGPFEIAEILGREKTLKRAAIAALVAVIVLVVVSEAMPEPATKEGYLPEGTWVWRGYGIRFLQSYWRWTAYPRLASSNVWYYTTREGEASRLFWRGERLVTGYYVTNGDGEYRVTLRAP